jgi:hypothetical protein
MFWDRKNQPIEDSAKWAEMYENPEIRLVALDYDDDSGIMVSTIWEGLDRGLSLDVTAETALIFETARIRNGEVEEAFLSNTEEEALEKHNTVCTVALGREARPEDGFRQKVIDGEGKGW